MIDPSLVTIIIPHLGGTPESEYALDQCKQSLDETAPNIKKILVVNGIICNNDHGFFNDKWEIIHITSQGQCKAVNAAAATVNTPWIFVSNDDMVYAPGWWEDLVDITVLPADIYNDFLCISPQLVEPRAGAPTFQVEFCGGAGGDFNKEKWLEFAGKDQGGIMRTGFNLPFLISKELWDLIGGYDINFDPWGSNGDSDLEYKIRLAGVQPYQNTNCIVYHFSQTSGTFNPENDSYRFRNYAYFKEKWGFDRTDNGIWEANFHMPTREEGRIFLPEWEGKYK